VLGAVEYFEWVGREFGGEHTEGLREYSGRTLELKKAMSAIHSYEHELNRALLKTLQAIPGITIFGLTDTKRLDERVATFSFRLQGQHPHDVAQKLADAGIYVWDGNYYALNVTERLDLEDKGGMVRVGAAHYNTLDEIAKLGEVLQRIAK
jgi:selenocysteine lyase/cysteine desulfurase